ncbi:hypothetical protein [Microvirga aerophila]|uniref:Uncharacterized protein n=1 Tax=Microvirga aerophila TaxID=670291 RepID=A0A512BWH9_9HYPH|nr:hypothetical protein [Microvirga aerophila]GEO16306.1 hypothetical protein MAE02_40020 [Microvirga aerophila]
MKTEPSKKWDPTVAAFCGAMVGMTLAIALEARDICAGRFDDVDPFVHIVTELAVFASGGAMLFAAVAGLRNRNRRSFRTNRRW